MMLPPSSRHGAFGDQNGPRIAEEVGAAFSADTWLAISVTSLETSVPSPKEWFYLMLTIRVQQYQTDGASRFSLSR